MVATPALWSILTKSGRGVKLPPPSPGLPLLTPLLNVTCSFYFFQWGEDSAEIQVNVVGKPDMPGGPLKVTEVTKKSCMLAWRPPADNGGYQITHYEVEKLDNTNGSWLPVKSVKSMSLEVLVVEFRARGYKIG